MAIWCYEPVAGHAQAMSKTAGIQFYCFRSTSWLTLITSVQLLQILIHHVQDVDQFVQAVAVTHATAADCHHLNDYFGSTQNTHRKQLRWLCRQCTRSDLNAVGSDLSLASPGGVMVQQHCAVQQCPLSFLVSCNITAVHNTCLHCSL